MPGRLVLVGLPISLCSAILADACAGELVTILATRVGTLPPSPSGRPSFGAWGREVRLHAGTGKARQKKVAVLR